MAIIVTLGVYSLLNVGLLWLATSYVHDQSLTALALFGVTLSLWGLLQVALLRATKLVDSDKQFEDKHPNTSNKVKVNKDVERLYSHLSDKKVASVTLQVDKHAQGEKTKLYSLLTVNNTDDTSKVEGIYREENNV